MGFNVIDGRAADFGVRPAYHYLAALFTAEGFLLAPVAALCALGAARARGPLLLGLAFIAAHSLVPHKELRFLFPALPIFFAVAALGLEAARAPHWAPAGLLAGALLSAATFPTLTYGRLGLSNPPRRTPALDHAGPENRLLLAARGRDDLCGLQLRSVEHWRTGGYSYLHRPVPLYPREGAPDPSRYNYIIARRGEVAGEEISVERDRALVRTRTGCLPDENFSWLLEPPRPR